MSNNPETDTMTTRDLKASVTAMREVLERYTTEHAGATGDTHVWDWDKGGYAIFLPTHAECRAWIDERAYEAARASEFRLRPFDEWHEDLSNVLWYRLPVDEPPYVGTPNDSDWPTDFPPTHWQPLPPVPGTEAV